MPSKLQSILLGGALAGLLSTSYLGLINQACCLGIIIAALVAVWHYTSENELTISVWSGMGIGALVAVIGSVIGSLLTQLLVKVGVGASRFSKEATLDKMREQLSPEQFDQIGTLFDQYFWVLILIGVVGSAIAGAIGGAIGAAIFKKAPPEDLSFE